MPVDAVVAKEFSADAQAANSRRSRTSRPTISSWTSARTTVAALKTVIARAGTIVWNGPVGVFEFDAFAAGTKAIAEAIADVAARFRSPAAATRSPPSPSSASRDKIGYISTGGGAFLEFLEGKTLPAVAALETRA